MTPVGRFERGSDLPPPPESALQPLRAPTSTGWHFADVSCQSLKQDHFADNAHVSRSIVVDVTLDVVQSRIHKLRDVAIHVWKGVEVNGGCVLRLILVV